MEVARRPMASAMSALMDTLRGKFSNRQGHSTGAFPLTSKRGPRDFYKGKGAKSSGRLTKHGKSSKDTQCDLGAICLEGSSLVVLQCANML